jgi:hypothetical protein
MIRTSSREEIDVFFLSAFLPFLILCENIVDIFVDFLTSFVHDQPLRGEGKQQQQNC